jgi:hypothetical protein
MQLGLFSVERHMILSCYSHESNRIGELDFQTIRAELNSLNAVHEDPDSDSDDSDQNNEGQDDNTVAV